MNNWTVSDVTGHAGVIGQYLANGPFYRIAPVMKNQRILFNYSEIAIDFTIFIVMYRARN